ncbi:metal ABC transporter substrate-binding protein [Clostridium lundense]|uniref:metal ABC transporter substrate-binding protein n=1 Tax=Clostridium lundense TaxID=319475 RepID=UPI00048103AD|nr:zinc ABC transporter substrate-binding protein [Clostridium lundense]
MKKSLYIVLVCCSIIFFACGNKNNSEVLERVSMNVKKNNEVNLNIAVTDKFLYFMTKDIIKDKHFVQYMFKNKEEEFNYIYSDDSLNNISKQDLFIYNGAGLEPWINEFLDKLNKSKVGIINISRGVNLLSYNKQVKYKNLILKENPYYWLNIDNYKIALLNIKNSIQDRDPRNRDYYEKNFTNKLKELEIYEKKFKEMGNKFKDYVIFYNEDEIEYFIKYSNMKVTKLVGNEKDEDIKGKINDNKNIIFLYSNDAELKKNAELMKKYNIKPVKLIVYKENMDYISILKYNINNLEAILKSSK